MDFAIVGARREVFRQFQVEAGHDVGLQLTAGLVPVGDIGHGPGLARELGRDRGLLAALLDQIVEQADPRGLAAGHGVVELAGKGRLAVRAARHPQMQAVLLAREARHVRTVGAHAEPRHRRTLHGHERRICEVPADVVGFLAPVVLEQAALVQVEQERAHRLGAFGRRVERGRQMPAAVAMAEQLGTDGDQRQELAMQEARAGLADVPGLELGEIGVVAASYVVEEGHGGWR